MEEVKEQVNAGHFQNHPENINRAGAPEKQWRWRELFIAEVEKYNEKKKEMKNKELMVKALVDKAVEGDVQAFDRIADRMEGKVPQGIGSLDEDGNFKEQQGFVLEFIKPYASESENTGEA